LIGPSSRWRFSWVAATGLLAEAARVGEDHGYREFNLMLAVPPTGSGRPFRRRLMAEPELVGDLVARD